jgi:hypothetical protein
MADGTNRMVFLGFGKYARADKIYALEPLTGDERGGGRRTRVWIEGVPDPIIAGRTERTILHEMGQEAAASTQIIDQSIELAERIAAGAESGRVDLPTSVAVLAGCSSRPPSRRTRISSSSSVA